MADPSSPPPPPPPQQPSGERAEGMEASIALAGATFVAKQFVDTIDGGTGKLKGFSDALDGINKASLAFSGISEKYQTAIENVINAVKSPGKGLESLTNALKEQISQYQKLNIELIQLGRGRDSKAFIQEMRNQSFEAYKLGISLKDLTDINKSLLDSYTGAAQLTSRQTEEFNKNRSAISNLIGFNNKFNIDQGQSITLLNQFNNVMGGGTKAAQTFSDRLIIFSQKAGIPTNKVFESFNSNLDRFSALSADKATASFQKLQMAATRTGESVSNIITNIEKFDDIETGFETGGQLNRVLSFMGGSFDTFRAIQADDEERAQMLYESISSVGDQFRNLQTTQAKRSFAKQLQESSGLDIKTIYGLLNDSTNLAKDISEISKKPIVSDEFTEEGRRRAAMSLTTNDQLKEIQNQLFDLSPMVARLSNATHENTVAFTGFQQKFAQTLDDKLKPYFERGGIKDIPGFAKELAGQFKTIPSEFTKYMEDFRKQQPIRDNIIAGNTTVMTNLNTTLSKGIKNDVKVEVMFDQTKGQWVLKGDPKVEKKNSGAVDKAQGRGR